MKKKLEDLRIRKEALEEARRAGAKSQHRAGKYSARERLDLLLDKDSFMEIAGLVRGEGSLADGDGVITGQGRIKGRPVFVYSQDFTVMGGSLGLAHARKIARIQKLALEAGVPLIGINDSGGARIQEGVDALAGYGDIFYNNIRASGVIPLISIVLGPNAGGAVYGPAMSDFVFMVDGIGQMFITGPDVIRAVSREETTKEELGGARVHSQLTGLVHFIDRTEEDSFLRVRQLLSYLPDNNRSRPGASLTEDGPRYTDRIMEILPERSSQVYDMKEIIGEIADGHKFFEVQKNFAPNIVVGFIRLDGEVVAVLANQPQVLAGCLDIDSSLKAARFVRTCDAFNIPILSLVDVPGFLPGRDQEHAGIIRHGAKLVYAYGEASVPKISLVVRKAYGGAYIAMASKHLGADFNYAYPSAEIAVMGAEAASRIIFKDQEGEELKEKVSSYKEEVISPYLAAERAYIDDIIEPRETRNILLRSLEIIRDKREEGPWKKHGNIPL